jgi:hypothetical protein
MPLRGVAGQFVGVAAADLTIAGLARDLAPPEGEGEGFLVADDGTLVVRAAGGAAARAAPAERFTDAEVWARVTQTPDGSAHVGDRVALWTRLHAAPWVYVHVVPDDMIER